MLEDVFKHPEHSKVLIIKITWPILAGPSNYQTVLSWFYGHFGRSCLFCTMLINFADLCGRLLFLLHVFYTNLRLF